jgi:hypothetical protein
MATQLSKKGFQQSAVDVFRVSELSGEKVEAEGE